ncbi:putative Transmembrane protein [Quillaja saponaria]|uniref:Transmembrane protein n=1 Tax=Quillaja saponaria TaxID=32244 RepID=A0AAD7L7B9_QUISA|nr:putative Transmembrane protein [Quillaja saponaria]
MMSLTFKSSLFLLVPTLLLISSFSLCHGAIDNIQGVVQDGQNAVTSWAKIQGKFPAASENTTLILAANRTHRIDPLKKFSYYDGGWDITNKNYFSSLAYTSVPLFVTAVIWFLLVGLCFVIFLFCYCCCCCFCRRKRRNYGYSRVAYAVSLVFLILLTGIAIYGSVVLYTAQGKFQTSTSNVIKFLISQANTTLQNLKGVLISLVAAKQVGIGQYILPLELMQNIDIVGKLANSSAILNNIQTEASTKAVDHFLKAVRNSFQTVTALMLLFSFSGFVLSAFGLRLLVYILLILGWILVTGNYILSALSLLVHNAVADTCVAMDEWVEHPAVHSALSKLLPCMDSTTAQEIFSTNKNVTFQLVNTVNAFIIHVANNDVPVMAQSIHYNQSGPLVPILCNPYNPDMTDRKCATDEVDSSNATKAWQRYACNVSASGYCTTTGRLTPTLYSQMATAANVSSAMYQHVPFLVGLLDCTFVHETFSKISKDHCPGLRHQSYKIYTGLVMVSVAVMFSLIFWLIFVRERHHQTSYQKHVFQFRKL